jgi:hypothetical protein
LILLPALLQAIERQLDRTVFVGVNRQLKNHGVAVRIRTMADATAIPSASVQHDGQAHWAGQSRLQASHGYETQLPAAVNAPQRIATRGTPMGRSILATPGCPSVRSIRHGACRT